MKKISFSILALLLFSINAYSQFSEGFENTTGPDISSTNWTLDSGNWAVFDNGIGTQRWGINSAITDPVTVYQGANAAYINRDNIGQGNTSENYLATPPIEVPTNGELHFFTRMFTSGNQGTIYQVKVAPLSGTQTNPNDYVLVQQWSEDELITPTSNFNIYTEKTVDLSAFAGQFVYIAFVKVFTQPTTSIDGDRWLIDSVGVNARCLPATGLTFSAITVNGATLNWINPNGVGTTWEIEVVLASGTPTGTPTHTTSTLPFVVTGLLPNTAYKYYVRAICTSGFSSTWSTASANFITGTAPPICGGNFVDSGGVGGNYANNENITTTICPTNPGDQVTVTFTSFNTQNGIDFLRVYDGNNASAPLLATLSGTTLPPAFTSSASSGCLTFVFTSNGTTTAGGWASNVSCAPAPTCSIPNTVTNTAVLSTTASIGWTQPANPDTSIATAWEILALPCGSAAPTAGSTGYVSATSNPFTLTGLTPLTCYDIYVRAVCSASDSSAWSRTATSFTTQAAPPVCGGNFVDSGGTTGSYSDNENVTTTICPTTSGDLVTVTFTSFSMESCCDSLRIYDGNSTAGTLLGTYTGTTLPPAFTSSAANGCLTFVFVSDSSVVQSGWTANVTCAPAPTCRKPTTITNTSVLSTSAVIGWTQPVNPDTSVATAWQVLALPCGSAAPTAASTGWVTASTNPFTLTGLSPTVCYDVYVRAVCSASDSSVWSAATSFTTQAAPPVCGGNFVDSGGTTGNYGNNQNITTTICPTTSGDLVTVTFTSFSMESCCDSLRIYDGNSTAGTLLGTYTGTTLPPAFTSSAANGCLTFVFVSDSSVVQSGWIANITCAPAPTCSKPVSITNTSVLSTSAVIGWTQPANPDTSIATAWQVLALPCGSAAPTAATTGWVPASTNPFTLTGLTPLTCYNVYIRAVCSASDSSAWSTATAFTTQALPPVCGGNFVDSGGPAGNYSNNENTTTTICPTNSGDLVTVQFTSFSMESCCDRLMIYDGSSTAGTLLGTYTGTALPPTYTSSSPGGCLTFVFTSDSSVVQTGWAANITCGPAPTCSRPTTLTNTSVLSTSAVIGWTQPANPDTSVATAWQILALPCGSVAPTAASTGYVSASTNPFTLTGLTPLTCYDVYVRAVCSASDSSAWSTATTFTTQALPPVCGGNFVDSGGPAGNYSNNENTTTTICPTNSGDLVTVQFTSFSMESCCDSLRIYDGSSTAAPLLGTYTGTALPPTYTSSSPGGCLTFVFVSDGSVVQTGWAANITCGPAPTCSKPITLTNTTVLSNSAVIGWTQPANPDTTIATAWEVLALPCGSVAPTAASTGYVSVSTNPFTLTGLTPLTCYDVYVRAVCSASDSSAWSTATTFTTQALPPVCGGNFVDTGGPTGNYNNNANITTTICPTSPGDLVTVEFTSFNLETGFDQLRIYDGDNTAAPLLGTYSGTVIPPTYTSNAANGCLTFVFTSDGSGTRAGWTSNVTCAPAPLCRKPTTLTTSALSSNSVNLAWTNVGNATSWEVLALPCGSAVPTAATTGWVPASTNPFVLTGLFPNTCYTIYVRGNCGTDGVSDWSTPVTITTQIAPPGCGGNFLDSGALGNYANNSNIGTLICPSSPTDKVTVTFTSFDTELNNDILRIYNGDSALAPLIGTYSGTTLPPSATSSAANGCLYFVFISNGSVTQTGWSSNITCAPAASCPNPLGVSASTVVTTTSQLSWIEAGSATSWQVLILPCGSPPPTNSTPGWISTTSNPYTVTGLTPNCCNQYYVRSVCSGSETSVWTAAYLTQAGAYVVWNTANGAASVTGTFPGGTVTVTQTGGGNAITLTSPAAFPGNLVVTGNNTFSTFGPTTNPPSRSLTFTFSTPVIIDRYSMSDVDLGGSWNDTFNFGGVTFTSTTSTNLTTTVTGAVATTETGNNAEYGSWFMSTTPVTSFSLNYATTGGLTHAYLAYALKVFLPCPVPLATLEVTVNSPTVCQGTPATVTATPNIPGTYNYTWTVPSGATNPGNVASFTTNVAGVYSVIITDTTTGATSTSASGTVTINTPTVPTFISPAPICTGTTAPTLPTTSLNGITGTWSPSVVDNTLTGTYTFTPNTGQCADIVTLTVTVLQDCSFGSFASAVWLTNCEDNNFFNTVGSGTSIIGPAENVFPDTDFGTYISNSGTFKLRGGEVKTFKSATANVCSARLNYRIYPQGGTPGTFTVLNLPFFEDCTSGSFPSGGPCSPGDQKWQEVLSDVELPADLTAFPAGDYVLEVFYDITGDVNSTTQCDDTIHINNAGNNFIATYTLQENPTYTSTNPTICNGNDGSITIDNLAPDTTYTMTYTHNSAVVGPLTITSNSAGQYLLSGLTVGVYANFNYAVNSCTFASTDVITLTVESIVPITSTDPLNCNGNNGTITISNLVPNQSYAVTYTDDTVVVGPITIIADTSGQIVLTGLNAGTYTNFSLTTTYCTATSTQVVTLVNPAPPVVTVNSSTICSGQSATITATPAVAGSYNYVWTVPAGFTNPGNVASFNTSVAGTYTVVITPTGTSFCNGSFESPTTSGAFPNMINEAAVPCWDTTAPDGIMEIWPAAGFEGVFAYQGSNFIEMNGNSTDTIFQDFTTYPGAQLQISFAHRGRQGNDVVGVEIGPIGGPYTSLGNFNDSNAAWVYRTLNYTIPTTSGNNYTIRFVSVSSTGGDPTVGNFIDAVSITSVECSSLSASGTVSLLPTVTLNLTSANNTQSVCINTAINAITYTSVNTTDVTVTGLPTGVTGSFDSGTGVFTISGTPTQSGTFPYSVSTVGGCNTVTLNGTIVVNPTVTATFTPITICRGDVVTLPSTSLEGFTGTWNPATVDNTQTGTYVFTPNSGQCAANGSLTITVNQPTPSTFAAIAAICNGDTAPVLPATSLEGFTGTWSPSVVSNTQSGTYTFTPTAGQCASSGTVSVTVNQPTPSTFAAIPAICNGDTAPVLPTTSLEGFTGTWSPSTVSNTLSGTYTFTPTAGQCASSGTVSVTVNQKVTATFNTVAPLCIGETAPALPATSIQGYTGTWTPAVIDNTASGTYTFVPDAGQCANNGSLSVTVQSAFDFELSGNCVGNDFILEVTSLNNTIDLNTASFVWSNSNGQTVGNNSSTFNVTEYLNSTTVVEEMPITFSVTVTNADGCYKSEPITLDRIFCGIQKGISVNNDGDNEFFDLTQLNVKHLSIFNRYGMKVYSKAGYTNEWKGQSDKGDELPDGTYYYVIDFNDNLPAKTGWIYINREY
ncbi:fibronectin type III domain-containing protein [Flavobacterium sp. AS60]|uniref:CUB domain-containing protein n=1 Tax=Flavobacterium anseongense TaxID=2910677 RepID=UPI001F18D3B3|nr:CUB domain-containing protein [Flavobacterium sp. AS60]MCF6130284.1 fibronectin type III domain-containing protein [Flavobacterium sp. AS60]